MPDYEQRILECARQSDPDLAWLEHLTPVELIAVQIIAATLTTRLSIITRASVTMQAQQVVSILLSKQLENAKGVPT